MDNFGTYFFIHQWPVLYEDNHLLALYKPAGLLIQGDRTKDITLIELAKNWLKKRYNKPGRVFLGMVHRLDRPVAGVVLFCRTSKASSRISEQFRTGDHGRTLRTRVIRIRERGVHRRIGVRAADGHHDLGLGLNGEEDAESQHQR